MAITIPIRPTLVLMTRWPAACRCKNRLAFEIGSVAAAASIQKRLTTHTLTVAQDLENKGLVELQLAVTGLASKVAKRWGKQHGIQKIRTQGEGSLGLRMR